MLKCCGKQSENDTSKYNMEKVKGNHDEDDPINKIISGAGENYEE